MSPLSWSLISLYIVISIVNLVFCFLENEKWRKITKPFCMLPLLGFVLSISPNNYWLWISIIFAWIGDVLFIFKHNKAFVIAGILSFLLAHTSYLFEFLELFKGVGPDIVSSYAFFLRFYPLSIIPAIPVSYFLSKKDWKLTIIGSIYQSALIAVFASAVFALTLGCNHTYSYVFILIGALFYYSSDFINAFTLYIKKVKRREVYIMSFYLLAQFLIVVGIIGITSLVY